MKGGGGATSDRRIRSFLEMVVKPIFFWAGLGLFDQKKVRSSPPPSNPALDTEKMGSWFVNRRELGFGVFE